MSMRAKEEYIFNGRCVSASVVQPPSTAEVKGTGMGEASPAPAEQNADRAAETLSEKSGRTAGLSLLREERVLSGKTAEKEPVCCKEKRRTSKKEKRRRKRKLLRLIRFLIFLPLILKLLHTFVLLFRARSAVRFIVRKLHRRKRRFF